MTQRGRASSRMCLSPGSLEDPTAPRNLSGTKDQSFIWIFPFLGSISPQKLSMEMSTFTERANRGEMLLHTEHPALQKCVLRHRYCYSGRKVLLLTVHPNRPNVLLCRVRGETADMTRTRGGSRGESASPARPQSLPHTDSPGLGCRRWRQWLAPHGASHHPLAPCCPLKRHVPSRDPCSGALACFLRVGLYPLVPERLRIWFPGQERGSPSLGLVSAPSSTATSSRKPAMADGRPRSLLYPHRPQHGLPRARAV